MSYFTQKFGVTGDKIIRPVIPLLPSVSTGIVPEKIKGVYATPYSIHFLDATTTTFTNKLMAVSGNTLYYEGLCLVTGGRVRTRVNELQSEMSIRIGAIDASPITLFGGERIKLPYNVNEIYVTNSLITGNDLFVYVFYSFEETVEFNNRAFTPFFKTDGAGFDLDALGEIITISGAERLRVESLQTGTVTIANTTKTIVRTSVSLTADGNLVAAGGVGVKIKVLGLFLFAGLADNIIIKNGSAGSALIGQCNFADNQGFVLPVQPVDFNGNFTHWIETSANTALFADVSTAAQVGGVVVHINEA
jgi:hypothetical protein